MRKKVLSASFYTWSFLLGASALPSADNLASRNWSVKAPRNLAANPPADDVVKVFMSKLDDDPGYPLGICYAKFADLHHSNMFSLVVAENDGKYCHLVVIEETTGGFRKYGLDLSRAWTVRNQSPRR